MVTKISVINNSPIFKPYRVIKNIMSKYVIQPVELSPRLSAWKTNPPRSEDASQLPKYKKSTVATYVCILALCTCKIFTPKMLGINEGGNTSTIPMLHLLPCVVINRVHFKSLNVSWFTQ